MSTREGMIAHAKGDLTAAIRCYKKALAANPGDEHALTWLGVISAQTGDLDFGISLLMKALRINPKNGDALLNLANAMLDKNIPDEAKKLYEKHLTLIGPTEPTLVGYCTCLSRLDLISELLHQTRDAVARYPASIDLWTHRANALVEAKLFLDALELTSDLLQALPGSSKILLLKARALSGSGDDISAKCLLEKLLAAEPNNLDVLIELGNFSQRADDLEAATIFYRKCLAIDPNCNLAKWNLAHILLPQKKFLEGWGFAKFRWGTKAFKNLQTEFTQTEWDGIAHDKPIYILGEQGLGDQLLYAGMAVEVLRRFPNSFLFINKKIVCLFNAHDLISRVMAIEELDLSGDFYYFYAADLGVFTRQDESDFPTAQILPFWALSPDPVIDSYISDLRRIGREKIIGLSWSSANPSLGDTKSPPLSDITHLVAGIKATFLNIQYGDQRDAIDEIQHITGKSILTVPGLDTFSDMARLAILVSQLDLVITISNTTAHLAGVLSVPTILMMPPKGKASFWYWHTRSNSKQSLWYPSVEVIGHDAVAGWAGTIKSAIAAATARLVPDTQ